jgi:hypothetical protein
MKIKLLFAVFFIINLLCKAQSANTPYSGMLVSFLLKNGNYIYVDSASMKNPFTKSYLSDRANTIDFRKENLAVVKFNNKWGAIDKYGNAVIPFVYDALGNNDGYSQEFIHDNIPASKNGKWGVINKSGKVLIPFIYDGIDLYEENKLVFVSKWTGGKKFAGDEKKGAIDLTGKIIIPLIYYTLGPYDGDIISADHGLEYGRFENYNSYGKNLSKILNVSYEYVSYLGGGNFLVFKNGKSGIIDKNLKIIIPLEYDHLEAGKWALTELDYLSGRENFISFSGFRKDLTIAYKNGRAGIINKSNDVIIPFQFDIINNLKNQDNIFVVGMNKKYGIINLKGEIITPIIYDAIYQYDDQLSYINVELDSKYGLLNELGELIIPIEYESSVGFANGVFIARKNGTSGAINTNNEIIIPFNYDRVERLNESFLVLKNEKFGIIDRLGNEITPLIFDETFNYGFPIGMFVAAINNTNYTYESKGHFWVDQQGRQYRE